MVPYTLAALLGVGAVAFPGAGRILDSARVWHLDVSGPTNPAVGAKQANVDNADLEHAPAPTPETRPSSALAQFEATPTKPAHEPSGAPFEIGDKLKIVLYERIDDVQQDKWGRNGDSGFIQRPEFSGEPTIEADGMIALALLGQFPAADRSALSLQEDLAAAFHRLTSRPGLVTIVSVERPPVYVLGPVKNPGPYKFAPGMTVLHAIALAGGFTVQANEPWRQLEAVKAAGSRRASLQLLPKLLARLAVLKAERDGGTPEASADLLRLTGPDVGEALIAQEIEHRRGIAAARTAQRNALAASLEMAQQEVQRISKLQQPIDALIALRSERAEAMKTMAKKGQIGRELVIQAQGDLMDAQQRKQDMSSQLALTAQRVLTSSQQEIARFEADARTGLDSQISALEQQIGTTSGDAATSFDVLSTLQPAGYSPQAGAEPAQYVVVRRGANGPMELPATGLTSLRPGDLVKLDQSSPRDDENGSAPGGVASESTDAPILVQDSPP